MSHEIAFQSAASKVVALKQEREPKQGRIQALLGDGAGNLVGNSGPPWVLARLHGFASHLVQAYNGTQLTPVEGMSVTLLIRYTEGRVDHYEIERLSNDVPYVGYIPGLNGGVPAHAISHEGRPGGGWDMVNVYPLNMTMLRADAQATPDMTVSVANGFYLIGEQLYYFAGGTSPAFVAPGAGLEYHVLTLDAMGTLHITVNGLTIPPVAFVLPTDQIPIVAVLLGVGQTSINPGDLVDIRPFLSIGATGGGGGAGHVHAIDRWAAAAAQTDFVLPDTASQLETVSDNGSVSDPLDYGLSADGTTLVYTSGRTAGHVIVAEYIVATT